ncbi:hypothetical protein OE88DRAFT_1807481 [Heliocybe sulcata]|uniref:G-patch domain-containing protein n=1 Tax=Heliocybe sulcata TaxID=5364 RepID=A0A5C3N701_9AGAM|nr:hypothetical protein OE88DRAFT_1807481 [Heliocybe sulcata]
MPLDGHAYLSAQGWAGTGSGLREGSISRPVIITQKKTLAGIGKDRDEAFPFWDHLYSAAAKAIKLKVADSDEEDSANTEQSIPATVSRTRTGIPSNRRPVEGTPATSGTATPVAGSSDSLGPKFSLLTLARKEAAKRGLYSMFFRGPVLGPDEDGIPTPDEKTAENVSDILPVIADPPPSENKRKRKEKQADHSKEPKKRRQEKEHQQLDKTPREENLEVASTSKSPAYAVEESSTQKRKRTKEEKLARKAEKEARRLVKLSRSKRDDGEESVATSPLRESTHSEGRFGAREVDSKSARLKKRKHREEKLNVDENTKSHKKKRKKHEE